MRVYDAVQRQMDAIESIQRTLRPTKEIQSERTVRILATLNKALREIAAITLPDESCNSKTGSVIAFATPEAMSDGPMARKISFFGCAPRIMKPPIRT